MRRFENTNPPHNKYWEIEVIGGEPNQYEVRRHWGKIGTVGNEKLTPNFSQKMADAIVRGLIESKVGEGYREVFKLGPGDAFHRNPIPNEYALRAPVETYGGGYTRIPAGWPEVYGRPSEIARSISTVNFGNVAERLAPPQKAQTLCIACRKNQSTSATDRCTECIRNKRTEYIPPEEKKDRFELIELD